MNTWGLSALGKLPMRLWRRFHIWRAKRMYRWVERQPERAAAVKAKADALMRRHAEDPQARLPLGDD
jgi:hypothetical protein